MAKVLRWVVDRVAEAEGEPAAGIAVTHPANWGDYKKDLLRQAVRRADLEDAVLVTEPEAAAIHYASQERIAAGSVVAVYDLGGEDADTEAPTTVAPEVEEVEAAEAGSPATPEPAAGEPAAGTGTVDLIRGDATPAFDDFATVFDGAPPRVLEIALYDEYAFIEVQVPDQPTYVDRYDWRGGLSSPDPVTLTSPESDELEARLFDLAEIDPSLLPQMAADGLAQFEGDGMEATHVIIDRFLPFDERVLVRVYVSDPERGGGGYASFTPDGGLVEVVV